MRRSWHSIYGSPPSRRIGAERDSDRVGTTRERTSLAEPEQVRRWRLQELEHAGSRPYDAEVLAATADVDLHLAVALLRDGCPLETALRILL
jgi:hypothetical protein